MPRVLVDRSVLIDHIRGLPLANAWLVDVITARVDLASVTPVRTELLAGMRPSAAAAHLLDAEVATLNVRDFPMFPDLQPAY